MEKAKAQTPKCALHPVPRSLDAQTPKSFHCHLTWHCFSVLSLKTRQLHYSCGQRPLSDPQKWLFNGAGSNETERNATQNPPRQFHMQMTKMNLINNCFVRRQPQPQPSHSHLTLRCIILMRFCWRQFFYGPKGGKWNWNWTRENLNVVAIAAIILITTFRIKWRDMRQIK